MRIDKAGRVLLICMAMVALVPGYAWAQAWPGRAVRLLVPVGVGSAPDVVARIVAERLAASWGQGVAVDNRPGAGGIPGMSMLARSPNDGYTIGFVPASMVCITPLVYKDPQFSVDAQLESVATVGTSPLLLVTPSTNGIKTLSDLERVAKARPGSLNFAATQANSLPHLAGEMLSKVGGLGLFTVPYANTPASLVAVLTGDATLTIDGLPGLVQHMKSGTIRALAVTSKERLPGFPDIPTVTETYPAYEPMIGWFAIFVPKGTPASIQERINHEMNTIMQDPEVIARLADLGIYPRTGDIASTRSFVENQRKLMKSVVTELGLQAQ